jgi:peptide-methionine (S)-S-oxide reductase
MSWNRGNLSSADFESAVSPNCIRPAGRPCAGGFKIRETAECNSALHWLRLRRAVLVLVFVTMGAAVAGAQAMNTNHTEFAYLGGGCFWCMDAVFQRIPGVKAVTSGYAGGHTENPTYEQVCTDTTGHAEVTRIEFDPAAISYEKLLDWFWDAHDPTTLNRQGADEGTQYRSIILCSNEAQKTAAEKSKTAAQKKFKSALVTEIVPLKTFYAAEKYHQDYYNLNSNKSYCRAVIRPKVEKIEKELKQGH